MTPGTQIRIIRTPDPKLSNGLNIQYGDTATVLEYDPTGSILGCFHYRLEIDSPFTDGGKVKTVMMDYDVEPIDGEDNEDYW